MVRTTIRQKTALIILGIVLTLVILEMGLRVGGFVILSIQRSGNEIPSDEGVYRILALGESTTAEMFNGPSSWPRELELILNNRSKNIKFKVFNEGIVGINTDILLAKLEDDLDKYKPHMVITMVGINDLELTVKYEDTLRMRINLWFKDIRVYKLIKLLWSAWKYKIGAFSIIKFVEAAEINESFIENDEYKKKDIDYFRLGRMYGGHYKFEEAEEMFMKAIEINPNNYETYFEFGHVYLRQGKYEKAEEMFKKTLELSPNHSSAYEALGQSYLEQEKFEKVEEMFKKAIKLSPNNGRVYGLLGRSYLEQGRFEEAEEIYFKAIELNSNNAWVYYDLGTYYYQHSMTERAEKIFKKAIKANLKANPNTHWAYSQLGWFYLEQGNIKEGNQMLKKAHEIRMSYYNPVTLHNYQKLYEVLEDKEIKYVAMQYPLRSIDELKIMFKGHEDIIFVSNENNFKEALKNAKYDDLFWDRFAGDFGHCTAMGNRLIAENIANVILGEIEIQ